MLSARLVERKLPKIERLIIYQYRPNYKPKNIIEKLVLEKMARQLELIEQNICPYCGRAFPNPAALASHWWKTSCGAALRTDLRWLIKRLVAASSVCVKKRKYICRECYKRFETRRECIEHVLRDHGDILV